MLLSGMIDPQTVKSYKKEAEEKGRDSWWLAYVMDTDVGEKERGKTVEVGTTTLDTP
jgi:peptide chain release factor subunit 3